VFFSQLISIAEWDLILTKVWTARSWPPPVRKRKNTVFTPGALRLRVHNGSRRLWRTPTGHVPRITSCLSPQLRGWLCHRVLFAPFFVWIDGYAGLSKCWEPAWQAGTESSAPGGRPLYGSYSFFSQLDHAVIMVSSPTQIHFFTDDGQDLRR
jgi:hypothetical protein